MEVPDFRYRSSIYDPPSIYIGNSDVERENIGMKSLSLSEESEMRRDWTGKDRDQLIFSGDF